MEVKNYLVHFDEYDLGRQYFTFADTAKKQIVGILNDTTLSYIPFFKFVIKYLLFILA